MREIFQKHLQPLDGETCQILQCEVSNVRFRRAFRCCVLQYALRFTKSGTGTEQSQLATGVMLGYQTQRVWEELRRLDLGREIANASPTFAPYSYVPELQMLVQVFPFDRGLPTLHRLVAGPPPELEPLLLARFGPGEWQVEAWEAEPVRYVAELRATLRLMMRARDVATGRAEERCFYAKVYRNEEKAEQTYQVLRLLWDRSSAGDDAFTVGKPVAYSGGLRTLIQEEVTGTSLWKMLLRGEEVTPAVRRAAKALAALHLDPMKMPRRYRLQDEIAVLEKRGRLLRSACPHLESEVKEVVAAIDAGLEETSPAPTHGDLSLRHVVFDGDRLALLDLDSFAGADPVLDVAHVLAHLSIAPRRFPLPQDRASAVARAFVEEYFAHAPKAWRSRLPQRYAAAVLKLAGGFARDQEQDWTTKIEALLEEAKDSLAGKVWQ